MFSRREWIVVLILVLVVVGVYGALLLLLVGSDTSIPFLRPAPSSSLAGNQPHPTPPWELLTAKEAYPQAEKVAREWRSDARLSGATAAWNRPAAAELTTGRTAWGFSFVSPSAEEMAIVTVTGQQVERIQAQPVSKVQELLDAAGWQVDSPQAARTFLEHGGEGFLRDHPDSDIHLRLSTRAKEGTILWLAIGLSADGQSSTFLQMDAISGRVLEP
jgi:hypothetical protein